MKTLRNTIATIAIATLLLSSYSFGQRTSEASADVTVSIYQGLSITNNGTSIAFPYTLQGETATLKPTEGQGAKFTISGSATRVVSLSYKSTVELKSSIGENLTFNTDLIANSVDDASTAAALKTDQIELNELGNSYVYVGGSIKADKTHEGDYSGTFTLSIAY
jgi:hypothetical protein